MPKSVDLAAQSIEFLCSRTDSMTLKMTVKEGKIPQIKELSKSAQVISLRALEKIFDNLSWAIRAVRYAHSHFRGLQS